MSSEGPNPYQAPAVDPADAIRSVLDDALQTRSRVEFDSEITKTDLIRAISTKAFRPDLARLRRSRWLLLLPIAPIALAETLSWFRFRALTGRWTVVILIMCALAVYATLVRIWLVRQYVKVNSDSIGPVKGWIDRDSIWIEREDHARFVTLNNLVGVTATKRHLVLSSDTTHTFFTTLPFTAFDDPDTAQFLAENLARVRPFTAKEAFDARRLEVPTDQPKFEPGEDAVFFSGQLLTADIAGTPLERSRRKSVVGAIGRMFVLLSIPSAMVLLLDIPIEFTLVIAMVILLVILRFAIRIYRAPIVGQADRKVLFHSAGWVDRSGIVSMLATGQAMEKWSALDSSVFSDRLIAARTKSGSLWYMMGRDQFRTGEEWDAARELVREHLPPPGADR